jgi:DNA modification methylase
VTSVKDLKSDHKNARRRTDRSASLIAESLKRFGAARSIVIDEDGRILAGNGTVEGAKKAGIDKLRIIEAEGDELIAVRRGGLSEDEKVGLALADNRSSDLSEWDNEMLRQLSEEHDLTPWFEDGELLAEVLEPEEGLTDADDVPEVPEEPITKPGDLWILGNHRLLCGDSTDVLAVERLMDGKKANLWLTDPPYNIAYEGGSKKRKAIENDSMGSDDFRQFLRDAYSVADMHICPGAAFYIWHADTEGYNFRGAAIDIGWNVRQTLIWNKNNSAFGRSDFHWKHEPCLYGWKEGAAHSWYNDRKQTTVLNFDRPSRSEQHPTMKPVDLIEYCLCNNTQQNSIVLDSFGGSGTTLIACERQHRHARLMELDPAYCDVIVKRWEAFTGLTAVCYLSDDHFVEQQEVF